MRGMERMENVKRRYKKKCKRRDIAFYLKDSELYNFSKLINFQKFVKNCLKYYTQVNSLIEFLEFQKLEDINVVNQFNINKLKELKRYAKNGRKNL